jgi:hypothetical protein
MTKILWLPTALILLGMTGCSSSSGGSGGSSAPPAKVIVVPSGQSPLCSDGSAPPCRY